MKFEEAVQEILNEKTAMGKYADQTFSLGPEDISEIVADADAKGKLSPEETDALENDLSKIMDKTYKKFKGDMDGADYFWALAEKAGKKYGIVIKR